MYFIVGRPAGFGGKELYAAHTENGQYGNGKKDNAQSAYPLCHASPEEKSVGQCLDIVENGGSGTAESGHRFEEGIGYAWYIMAEVEREHSK